VSFLLDTIRRQPHEVTLLAIGAMTNVALLFAMDPQIPSLLKELVLMVGVYTPCPRAAPGSVEYNAICDPDATAIVFAARPPKFTCIGLDVTTQCSRDGEECARRFHTAGGPLGVVADMAAIWFRDRPQIVFHDPLAAALIFEPDICRYRDGKVSVETTSPDLAGLTRFSTREPEKPHRVATEVDADRFFEHYFATVGA
jgi:purine nucleosidase